MALIKLNSRAIPDDTVIASDIADGSISTAKLAADAVTTAKLAADAVTTAKIADSVNRGRRNKIINGGFQVWQRGTSFTTSAVSFAADRFAHYQATPSANNVTQSTDVPDGFTYSCSLNDAVDMRCTVELPSNGVAGEFYNGSTWTLSFYARVASGADLPLNVAMRFVNGPSYANFGSAWSDSNITITSTWQRFEIQYTVNDTPTSNHYAVGFVLSGSSGRVVRYTGIQLEAGDTATPFEHRSYTEELSLCQRYYSTVGFPSYSTFATGQFTYNPSTSMGTTLLAQTPGGQMRVTPTMTFTQSVGDFYAKDTAGGTKTLTGLGLRAYSGGGVCQLQATSASNLENDDQNLNVGGSGASFQFDSEL